MEDNSDYCTSNLEHCSYRELQKLAKSMNLPSNVKRIYLVEMINAKKCSPPSEAERIVRRIKLERQHLAKVKKRSKRSIIPVDTSSNESLSPPISITPKRPPFTLRCSELRHQMMRSQDTSTVISTSNPNASDRVLRSCNLKLKRTFNKYAEVNQRHVDTSDQNTHMNPIRVIKKYKPNTLSNSYLSKDRQLAPATHMHMQHLQNSTQILVKRPRLPSGIYPIGKELVPVGGVGVRNREGKMASIAAFIRKPGAKREQTSSMGTGTNIELTLQDIINGNVDAHTSLHYPNTSGVIADTPEYTEATGSEYYHKKIRAEQVRERRMSTLNTRCELPRINEAFGQFRGTSITYDRHDVTQPLYVQVGEESERILNDPQFAKCNTGLLETVYNFKSNFLTSQPLLQIATTANTKCVYSTPVVATAAPHIPATITCAEPYMASYEREIQYYGNTDSSQMNDGMGFFEQEYHFRCTEDFTEQNRSCSSVQSQELGANVTISDMVEDALELISQDGDYMERMGMDVTMQCVLCTWAGPRILFEYHIRKEHSKDIDKQAKNEWHITYTLGSVAHQLWRSHVVEYDSALYVISVKCEPGCFTATLSSITSDPDVTTGSITVFNRVTGEPHTWSGLIQELPPSLSDSPPGLQLDVASLDLIPNSANLKLLNGELVLQSPTKVVFGQIELNDIHIILFVKTSRVLDSTYRYVKFVRKLRALEEEQRKGDQIKLNELKDKQYSDFFISCDRKSLLNNVARRVELCMESYQADLAKKKERLKELLAREEEENIRKFVVQVQAARETAWQDKKDRLAFLIAKRKKEHEEKFKDTPLSKCVHVLPCLVKVRAMEAQDVQLYQMREKAARQAAEKEFEKMWHEVAMKESEALAARMEYDVIQRARRDMDCHKYSVYQAEQNKINQQKEKERLKQETLYFRGLWDKAIKDEEEAERRRTDARHKTGRDRDQAIEERKMNLKKLAAEQEVIQDAWDSLAGQGLAAVKAEEELIKRKERELDQCNRKMIELRDEMRASESANDEAIYEEAQKYQKVVDQKRCQYLSWSQKTNKDVRKAMIDQIHDRKEARVELKKKLLEQDEYHRQLFGQLTQLAAYKDVTDAQQRKRHQENLVKQIEYNKYLKEQALKEEQDQIKKCQRATEEYNQEISRMLCRPFYSDMQHPFLRQMAGGLKMKEKCPCSKPDYCAVPDAKPKS